METKAPRPSGKSDKKKKKTTDKVSESVGMVDDSSETVVEESGNTAEGLSSIEVEKSKFSSFQELDNYAAQLKVAQDKFVGKELIGKNTWGIIEIIASNIAVFKQRTAPAPNELKTETDAYNKVKNKINAVKTALAKPVSSDGLINGTNTKKRMNGIKLAQEYLQMVCDRAIAMLDDFAKTYGDDKHYALKSAKDSSITIPGMLAIRLIFWARRSLGMKGRKAAVDIGGLTGDDEKKVLQTFNKGVQKEPDDSLSTELDDFVGLVKKSEGDSVKKVKPQANFNSNWHTKFIGLTFPYNVTSGIPSQIRLGISMLCSLKKYPLAAVNGLTFYSLGMVYNPKTRATIEVKGFYKWSVGKKGIRANKVLKYESFNDMPSNVFSQLALIAVN